MTRLRRTSADDLTGMAGSLDVHAVIAALDLPPMWRENGYYVTREATTTPEERLRKLLRLFNAAWGADVGLDDWLAAVVAHADDVEARMNEGATHLYDEQTRRRRAEKARDELRRLLAEAGPVDGLLAAGERAGVGGGG